MSNPHSEICNLKSPRGAFTLLELLVVIAILCILAALGISFRHHSHEAASRVSCAGNLYQMYKGMQLYVAQFGRNQDYPPHVGERFFLCLTGCPDPKHRAGYSGKAPFRGSEEIFKCPSARTPEGTMDYRGPKQYIPPGQSGPFPSALTDGCSAARIIGCDKAGNHRDGGGNVLRFDGSVQWAEGAEYERALGDTE